MTSLQVPVVTESRRDEHHPREPAPFIRPSWRDAGTPLTWCYRAIAVGLAVSDVACAVAGLLVANLVLTGREPPAGELVRIGVVVPLAWTAAFIAFGLYSIRQLSAIEEFRRLIGATCVATSLVTVFRAWANVPPYRKSLLLTWLVALGFNLVARRIWRWKLRCLRQTGHLAARTVIVGTNEEAARLANNLRHPDLGFRVLGHVTTRGAADLHHHPVTVVGGIDDLETAVLALGAECIFVACTAADAADLEVVGRVARYCGIEVRMSTNLADILISRLAVQSYGDVLALSVRPVRLGGGQAALKRAFDIVTAGVMLLLALPVMAVVAVTVRVTSPGKVLFRQERVTRHGRRFVMLKFRTMVDAVPSSEDRVIDLTVPFFKLDDDPRITPVGRILRKFSLDELPQLWQVVRGELSLVGPRPLPAVQVDANPTMMAPRHQVRAGLTGWWQVNGRSDLEADQALRLDLFYIENWSLSLDIFILLRTVGTVVLRRGAC